MAKFFNCDLEDFAHQLTHSPRRLHMTQICGIDKLLGLIEPQRAYPFEFVCYHITGYQKRGQDTTQSIPGEALINDLIATAELVSRRANLTVDELGEPFKTHQEVADQLGVSTKTIRRWRSRGLMGIRAVYDDGVSRLAFLARTVERFVASNRDLVSKGASFKQLSEDERTRIVSRARELVSAEPMKLHATARVIAEETGRAVETVRYTLRRFDSSNPTKALFTNDERPICCERYQSIWRCKEAGESIASIARAFDCSQKKVRRILRQVQVLVWAKQPWDYIHSELFDAPNADALVLDVPEPAAAEHVVPKIPRDLPPYLRSLYQTPLLTREQEQDCFRRYNYLKCKTARVIQSLDLDAITDANHMVLASLVERVATIKQLIIQSNLRLVVSIAKKHVGWSSRFFEVISDGNVSLMRAVEKFDFDRGTRFSTYATWAIVKNYARSIPEQHYHFARYMTGQDELLHSAPELQPHNQDDNADASRVKELIQSGMEQLDDREREIVAGHFGLGGTNGGITLEQLGKRFGVTKERIRQIEKKALARLREVLSPSLVDSIAE